MSISTNRGDIFGKSRHRSNVKAKGFVSILINIPELTQAHNTNLYHMFA